MSQTSAQNRERAVKAITQRNMLQRRIERSQKRLKALQDEAHQGLQDSITADQAALAEATQTMEEARAEVLEEFKADMERIRRKTDEALHLRDEWRRSQFLNSYMSGGAPPSPGQALTLLVVLGVMVAMISAMLILNR